MNTVFELLFKICIIFMYVEVFLFIAPTIFKVLSFILKGKHRQRMLYSGAKGMIRFRKKINSDLIYQFKNFMSEICNFSFDFGSKRILSKDELLNKLTKGTPEEFEKFCGKLYTRLGYNVTVMPEGNDGGKDVIATDKFNNKIYIECKRYHPENGFVVGREICQKLIGSCAMDSVDRAVVFTTGKINNNAYEYQRELNGKRKFELELVNYDKIYDLYRKSIQVNRTSRIEDSDVLN